MTNKIQYQTKIDEGRCQGTGKDYRPWFEIHEREASKPGIALRFRWKTTGRMHQIIGRNRINYFYDLIWDDEVVDIMENYVPMSREETAAFAQSHGLTPPRTQKQAYDVIVTDFLITYRDGSQKAVDVLKDNTLHSPAALIRHQVKAAYWKSRGIPFLPVYTNTLSQKRANLIQHLMQPLPHDSRAYDPQVLSTWLSLYNSSEHSLMDIARTVEEQYQLPAGDGILAFWYLAASKKILIDPEIPLTFSRKRKEVPAMPEWPFETSINTSALPNADVLENACFQKPDASIWRILCHGRPLTHIIEVTDKVRMPKSILTDELRHRILQEEYRLLDHDPFQKPERLTTGMQAKQELWEKALAGHPVKTEMVWNEATRAKEAAVIANALHVSSDTALRQLSRFWQSGFCPQALAGKASNSGQTRESHMRKKSMGGQTARADNYRNKILQADDLSHMHTVIMTYYARPEKPTIDDAHQELINRFYRDDTQADGYAASYPSKSQFYRYLYQLPKEDLAKIELKRLGHKGAPLKGRAYFGNLAEAYYGFGDCAMLDATELDFYLCYRFNRQEKLGRAVLYYGIDVVTTQIPMFYLGIKSESRYGARMLILVGLTNKVKLGQRFGVEIREDDFPGSPYLPHCIVCDNSEMRGTFMDSFAKSLGISVCNTLVNRGDLKSLVERHFSETLLRLGHIKGRVSKEYKENTGKNYVKEAVLTIPEAWKLITQAVVDYNRHRAVPYRGRPDWMDEKVTPTPDGLARWCLTNSTGRLRQIDPALVNVSMLPEATARVTPSGLLFHDLQYVPENESQDAEFVLARKHWKKKSKSGQPDRLKIHHDPTMVSIIYRIVPESPEPIVYRLSTVDEAVFGRMSLIEILLLTEIRKKQLAEQAQIDSIHKARLGKLVHETEKNAQKSVKRDQKVYGKNGKISKHARAAELTLQVVDDLTHLQQEQLTNHLLHLLDANPDLTAALDRFHAPDLNELP